MLWAYVNRILRCVFNPTFTWLDAAGLLLGLLVPPMVWLTGGPIAELAIDVVSWELIAGLVFLMALRAIAAPYLMWRELISYVSDLHRELDSKRG